MRLAGIVQQASEPYDFNGAPACRVAVRYAGCTQTKTAVFIFYSKVRARSIEPYEKSINNNE